MRIPGCEEVSGVFQKQCSYCIACRLAIIRAEKQRHAYLVYLKLSVACDGGAGCNEPLTSILWPNEYRRYIYIVTVLIGRNLATLRMISPVRRWHAFRHLSFSCKLIIQLNSKFYFLG